MKQSLKILVTGSSGFLGSWLVNELVAAGHEVTGIDKQQNSFPYQKPQQFFLHDLRKTIQLPELQFDRCIHLASSAGGFLQNAQDNSLIASELLMLRQIYTLCSRSNCKRLIYTSSINVFESEEVGAESALIHQSPATPYAKAKKEAEQFIDSEFENFFILRPTNFFGPNQPLHSERPGRSHVIPELLRKISDESSIEVYGDGSQIRNFLHLSDISRFIELALYRQGKNYAHLRSELFLSIRELALQLLKFKASDKKLRFLSEFMKYEPRRITRFEIQTAQKMGWHAEVNELYEGLTKNIRITEKAARMSASENQKPQLFSAS